MMNNTLPFKYNDGGRRAAGFTGEAGDCVVRAIAIAGGYSYLEVYEAINKQAAIHERGKSRSTARGGVYTRKQWFKDFMASLGFRWHPFMGIGTGCKVHLRQGEIPNGRIICVVSRHYTAVIDGVINDIYDPSRGGNRCVYGYWTKD